MGGTKRYYSVCQGCGGQATNQNTRCRACYNAQRFGNYTSLVTHNPQVISPWEALPGGVMRRTVEGGAATIALREREREIYSNSLR